MSYFYYQSKKIYYTESGRGKPAKFSSGYGTVTANKYNGLIQ